MPNPNTPKTPEKAPFSEYFHVGDLSDQGILFRLLKDFSAGILSMESLVTMQEHCSNEFPPIVFFANGLSQADQERVRETMSNVESPDELAATDLYTEITRNPEVVRRARMQAYSLLTNG